MYQESNDIYSFFSSFIDKHKHAPLVNGWYDLNAKVHYVEGKAVGVGSFSLHNSINKPEGYIVVDNYGRQQSKRESCRDIDSGQAPISIWPNVGKNARVRGS